MDEQDVMWTLKAYVARQQSEAREGQESTPPEPARVSPAEIHSLSASVRNQRDAVGQLNPRNAGFLNRLVQAFKKLVQRSLEWYTRSVQEFNASVTQAIEGHGEAINSLQEQMIELQKEFPLILAEKVKQRNEQLEGALRTAELATMEQQSAYVGLFEGLSPVLDLGCGRGEFLELLKEAGIPSYGVDSDYVACSAALRKQVKVDNADIFDYLRELPDRSLGGIFSARVLEYVPPHLHGELVALCAQKLKPRGILVIETANPDANTSFGRTSQLDPTHVRAVYPEVLKSMLDSSGFKPSKICVLSPAEVGSADDVLQARSLQPDELSHPSPANANAWSRARAYAAIAWRN